MKDFGILYLVREGDVTLDPPAMRTVGVPYREVMAERLAARAARLADAAAEADALLAGF